MCPNQGALQVMQSFSTEADMDAKRSGLFSVSMTNWSAVWKKEVVVIVCIMSIYGKKFHPKLSGMLSLHCPSVNEWVTETELDAIMDDACVRGHAVEA